MRGKIQTEHDRQGLIELINRLDISKPYTWEVKRKVARRSISQNSLYWMYLQCISQDTGNDVNALHEAFKQMYLIPVVVTIGSKDIRTYSTKGLTTILFNEYLEKITAEAGSMGIILPNPDDLIFDSFVEEYKDRM